MIVLAVHKKSDERDKSRPANGYAGSIMIMQNEISAKSKNKECQQCANDHTNKLFRKNEGVDSRLLLPAMGRFLGRFFYNESNEIRVQFMELGQVCGRQNRAVSRRMLNVKRPSVRIDRLNVCLVVCHSGLQ